MCYKIFVKEKEYFRSKKVEKLTYRMCDDEEENWSVTKGE